MSSSPATLTGNIAQDPKLQFTNGGTGKLSFGLACSHYWTDQSGEKQEKTSFFNVVAWRNLAEEGANLLEKGMRITVVGRLEQRSYEDKEGQNRSIVELVADDISLSVRGLESVKRRQRSEGGQQGGKPSGGAPRRPQRPQQQQAMIGEEEEPF